MRADEKRDSPRLYAPEVQLEKLPARLEGPYHSFVAWLGRCLPAAIALFVVMTIFEGATGTLSDLVGSAWDVAVRRPASTFGGQGNLGYRSLIGIYRHRAAQRPVRAIFAGDSVFAPGLGPGTHNDLALEDLAASQIPGALNLSEEGMEWAANSLLISRLAREPEIQRTKPTLVVDIDLKYFGTTWSLTPAFPVELGLCFRRPDPADPYLDAACDKLKEAWPPVMAALAHVSPFLLDGLQGQMDFFLTFVMRSPSFHFEGRPRGLHPLRAIAPGIVEASLTARDYRENPPDPEQGHYTGAEASVEYYAAALTRAFYDPYHPKRVWLNSLIRTLGRWPGRLVVMFVRPSPAMEAVMRKHRPPEFDQMQAEVGKQLRDTGKTDIVYFANKDVMKDPADYTDGDHLTRQGHRKLARYLEAIL